MQKKKALITGITGQDNSCLVGSLLSNGRVVRGVVRGLDSSAPFRINRFVQK